MLGWTAVLFSIQQWLSETPAQKAVASSPAYFSVGMAVLSLLVVSLDTLLFAVQIRLLTSLCRDTCHSSCLLRLVLALVPEVARKLPLLLRRECIKLFYF